MQFSYSTFLSLVVLVLVQDASANRIKLFGRPHQEALLPSPDTAHIIEPTPAPTPAKQVEAKVTAAPEQNKEEGKQGEKVVEVKH